MVFTKESQTVKNYILLINEGLKSTNEVPNLFNLKEVVEDVINNKNNVEGNKNDI